MASNAVSAHGTLLQFTDGAGGWITVSEQTQVDYSTSRDEVDTSIHNEPLSYRNYIAGPASGEIALTINWLPSDPTHDNTNGLQSLYTSGLKKLMRLLWTGFNPDYSMTFTGFVRQWNVAAPAGTATAIQAQSVIRIDGTPTFA